MKKCAIYTAGTCDLANTAPATKLLRSIIIMYIHIEALSPNRKCLKKNSGAILQWDGALKLDGTGTHHRLKVGQYPLVHFLARHLVQLVVLQWCSGQH